jgi:hypothetical protein
MTDVSSKTFFIKETGLLFCNLFPHVSMLILRKPLPFYVEEFLRIIASRLIILDRLSNQLSILNG